MHDIEHRLGDASVPESEHEAMLARYSDLQDRFRLADGYNMDLRIATVLRGLGFDPEDAASARRKRSPAAGRCASRSPSCCSAVRTFCCSTNRPTTSTSRHGTGSRNISRLPLRGDPGLARSLLPRRGRHPHHRSEPADADRLRRQLQPVRRAARRDARAASSGEARTGRRSGAHQDVHRPLPLPGDEGGAGPEPDQAAREGRADRGSSGAQARSTSSFPPAPRAAERCSRLHARAQGLRRSGGVPRCEPAHRARRPHCARRSERRRQVDADADALGRGGAGHRRAYGWPPGRHASTSRRTKRRGWIRRSPSTRRSRRVRPQHGAGDSKHSRRVSLFG